uniref:Uncharacterized protein n=1 Tax=viral metagenome TaxID=1070528 RepID=A0A6C0CR58_9ZZZZ
MEKVIASKIAILIEESILKGEISKDSPMKLIAKGMEMLEMFPNMKGDEKKALLVKAIEKIAVGADGVAGTDDDIIPKSVVDALKTILEKDLIGDIIQVIAGAARGEFNLQQSKLIVVETAKVTKTCIPTLMTCLLKK